MDNLLTIDIKGDSKMVEVKRSFRDLFNLIQEIWAQSCSIFAFIAILVFGFN